MSDYIRFYRWLDFVLFLRLYFPVLLIPGFWEQGYVYLLFLLLLFPSLLFVPAVWSPECFLLLMKGFQWAVVRLTEVCVVYSYSFDTDTIIAVDGVYWINDHGKLISTFSQSVSLLANKFRSALWWSFSNIFCSILRHIVLEECSSLPFSGLSLQVF